MKRAPPAAQVDASSAPLDGSAVRVDASPVEVEASPAQMDLRLGQLGTRFVDGATERRYLTWNLARLASKHRALVTLSFCSWVPLVGMYFALEPAGMVAWIPALALLFATLAGLAVALQSGTPRAVEWAAVAHFATGGLLFVGVGNFTLHARTGTFGALLTLCAFQCALTIARPLRQAATIAVYLLCEAAVVGLDLGAQRISPTLATGEWVALGGAFALGLATSVFSAAAARESYRQVQIIEAQRETIARERLRSEALLKRELGHQVAQRSRELGAAFARAESEQHRALPRVGERFDARYQVLAVLGTGAMGAVYDVERLTDGQRLALKTVTGPVHGPSVLRFAREAEIGARLRHPNLVEIVDVGICSGVPFLVMELLRGGALEQHRGRFGDAAFRPWALIILRQIVEGLAALHAAGVVHRDLKPANILLAGASAAPVAKICDFGISRFELPVDLAAVDPDADTLSASLLGRSPALTRAGALMGTPLYMAPEAALGADAIAPPADVFALGLIGYELLCGKRPFEVPAVVLAVSQLPLPAPLPLEDATVPEALRRILLACLAEAAQRRPTIDEVLRALAQAGVAPSVDC